MIILVPIEFMRGPMALKSLCSVHRSCLELSKLLLPPRCNLRYSSSAQTDEDRTKLSKRCLSKEQLCKMEERKKIKFYFFDRFLNYIYNYDKLLEKRFPKAMTMYRTFMDGVKSFYKDTKEFVKIVNVMNTSGNGIKSLTRREIELYDRMPGDMLKIGPVLLVSTLPLANYVIFPLIYMYPKQILTSHFWNDEQKRQFTMEILTNRLSHNRRILKCLINNLSHGPPHWNEILLELRHGKIPMVSDLAACKPLFVGRPFHVLYLPRTHVKYLLKVHDLHSGFARKTRLHNRGLILKAMDHAILMEGGVHNLTDSALCNACIIRGLNPVGLTREYMVDWLQKWMTISSIVDRSCTSLLLHAPLFLGLNEPNNKCMLHHIRNT